MARIILDARELTTSTGRYVERLLHYLQKLDGAHDYMVLLKPGDYEAWQPDNPRFAKVPCPYKEFSFGEQLGLLRQIRKLKPDLVHFTMTQQPILDGGKVVTTIHDLTTARFSNPTKNRAVFGVKQWVYKKVIKRVARKSVALITPSQFVKADVAQYADVPVDKITVTHEAADKLQVTPKVWPQLAGKSFLLYIGRATPHKNLRRAVDALAIVRKTHPDTLLALAGKFDDSYKLLKKYVERQALSQNLIFTDFVSEEELAWLYQNATAYLFPSLSEGFGLPGVEAMAQGLPVLAAKATCLPEIYGEAALYFDPLDIADMAAKINQLLDSEELRQKLIAAGYVQAAKYSWDKMTKQTLEVYKRVLDEIKTTS